MNIQADKFLALTAMLAGFVPAAGCSIKIDGSASSSESNSNSNSNSNSGATDTTGDTAGTTQDDPTGTTGSGSATGSSGGTTEEPTTDVPTTTVGTLGTMTSSSTSEGTSTGGVEHDCCEPKDTPGCSDMAIQECVCAEDPICCGADAGFWDSICVGLVNALGCGMCEIVDTTGEGGSSSGGSTGP